MGSRIRSSPSLLVVCWCEVVAGQGADQPPYVIQKFPNTYDDQQTLNSIPQFVYPCKVETAVVQTFSFVLTAIDSTFTFGYCRHSPNSQSAIVVLSHLPWDSTFYKVLNLCSELQLSDTPDDVWGFLKALYQTPVPDLGSELTITYPPNNKIFVAKCPNHLGLPSLPENRNLLEYYNAVDSDTMMAVFASMLFERRILVSSRHLHRLSACVQAANALLYPMTWQHIYIPIIPECLLDYLHAPMPFLIGVPDILMSRVHLDEVGDVVYLNADTNSIQSPFQDLAELPNEVSSVLRRRLKHPAQGMGDSVPRAFLHALVMLIGNYRDALQFREDERKVSFNEERFVAGRPHHLQPFVEKMLNLQIFRQFLEERLELVNKGEATSDEFELEMSVYSDKPKKNFQQLLHAARKEGGAIVKNFKSKTNPAVKSAVKSVSKSSKHVKERSQEKYKEIRGRIKQPSNTQATGHKMRDGSPTSDHSSPVSSRRSVGHVTAKASYRRPDKRSVRESGPITGVVHSPESPGHTPTPNSIDLVGELEQELVSRLCAPSPHPRATRPTTLPPPIPHTRANTTLGTTTTAAAARAPPSPNKDKDLILLGSPQEEDFDPLLSKTIEASPPRIQPPKRPDAPHPVPSFLHSTRHDLIPAHDLLQSSSSSSSSLGSIYQPYLPLGSALSEARVTNIVDTPGIPVPARRTSAAALPAASTAITNKGGVQQSIPGSTMASLPAALQNHLANKLDTNPRAGVSRHSGGALEVKRRVFEDPRFVPFSSVQSTSSMAPRMQANPMYNVHQVPFSTPSPTPLAAAVGGANNKTYRAVAFASTMLDQDNHHATNNNAMPSKMLLNEYSESFAQMKLNKGSDTRNNSTTESVPVPSNQASNRWTSFE